MDVREKDILTAMGLKPEAPELADTPVKKALAEMQKIDGDLMDLAAQQREPTESVEQSYARMMRRPGIAQKYHRTKAGVLAKHGIPNSGSDGSGL